MTTMTLTVNGTSTRSPYESSVQAAPSCAQSWCGRCVSTVNDSASAIGHSLLASFQATLKGLHLVAADANAVAAVCRKLDQHVLKFCEYLKDAKGSLGRCSSFMKSQVAFIDFAQIAADVYYFGCGKFKEKRNEQGEIIKARDADLVVAAKVSLGLANTMGGFLWLEEMGFFSLSKAAAAIGEVRLFSLVPKTVSSIPVLRDISSLQSIARSIGEFRAFSFVKNLNCLFLVLRGLDLGYALLAIDASNRLAKASNNAQVVSASLDLSSYLSELMLSGMLLVGVTNIVSLGLAGTTCIAFTVSSFLYRITHDKEINQKTCQACIS